jgi:hypothetical protein
MRDSAFIGFHISFLYSTWGGPEGTCIFLKLNFFGPISLGNHGGVPLMMTYLNFYKAITKVFTFGLQFK